MSRKPCGQHQMRPETRHGISAYVGSNVHIPNEPGAAAPLSAAGPSAAEISAPFDYIQKSRIMSRCGMLIRLLVEETLKGEAGDLKETTIGVLVFGRLPDYDPKAATIVRGQAWRLRAKLEEYYATEGIQDRIVVSLPQGH